ncbi:two-component system sensor histidine kinase NtrB [Desulfopila inferna]|uniref:two-component system sensor histidine kinase NtrB n=1 Tax=Desulfopila inferna TaxID=468528 RepID=UPI0019651E79|nr:ATP-binding protein [Desulfopila inferna]MBM9603633.1 ATP-binding protein [Desulfopila inferna]
MKPVTTLEDLVGIEHTKLGFYQELQQKIKQLKASNLELDKKRKKVQAVLDGITDLMAVLSDDSKIERVNHVFHKWFPGVDPLSQYFHETLCGKEDICEHCPVKRSLQNDDIVKELCINKVEGKYKHFRVIASPLESGVIGKRQILLSMRDVTLEKEFQAQFYQAEKMATIGVLAAGVAHEINNPLAGISGFAEGLQRRIGLIRNKVDPHVVEDFEEYTQTIINECIRCRDIVQTLLTFSRPVASSLIPVNINSCVRDTLFILKHHFKEHHNIAIKPELGETLPLIMGDEPQLKQVIINLITNAFDATGEDGEIKIQTTTNEEKGVTIIVEDSGCGIPLELQDKLFEPFFTTKPAGKGSIGIGLSTCFTIVNNHGGSIAVTSDEGLGSTFRVMLPGIE